MMKAVLSHGDDGDASMTMLDRITVDPNRLNGQPCIRDLRLTVRRVLEALALYPSRDDLRREYPELEDEDIRQALEYAAAYLDDRLIDLSPVR
jgi:uncharacterized protein (DUF433 family)